MISTNINSLIQHGINNIRQGNLVAAESVFNKVLNESPKHPDALHLLGVVCSQKGKKKQAVRLIRKAIKLNPNIAVFHRNLGLTLIDIGKRSDAINAFKRAIHLNNRDSNSHNDLGSIYSSMKMTKEAMYEYKRAITIDPNNYLAFNNLGNELLETGKLGRAVDAFEMAIKIRPDFAEAYSNCGNAFKKIGRLNEAVDRYNKAIQLKPDFAKAYSNRGVVFMELGMMIKAVDSYHKAIQYKTDFAEAYNNRGVALRGLGMLKEALDSYKSAIQYKSDYSEAYRNQGNIFSDLGLLEQAVESYDRSIETDPDNLTVIGQLCHIQQKLCNWGAVENLLIKINDLISLNEVGELISPFIYMSITDDLEKNYTVAVSYSSWISERMKSTKDLLSFDYIKKPTKKIRIGYLSSDIHNHATMHLMLGLFREHDKKDFEIYVYSYGENNDGLYRNQVIDYSEKFIDISGLSYADAAREINNDGIDILVDLKGHTTGNRMEICALRPAPIQVTYLGFPGTSGANFFDYMFTDTVVTPIEQAGYYSEKFAFLPDTYQATDNRQAISNKSFSRMDFGLPEDGFVFASFNQSYKIDPVFFDVWMRLIKNVTNSVLWLFSDNSSTIVNLKEEAEKRGVDSGRIVFAEKMSKDEHLRRMQLSDLVLDTRVVNGHTTTSDALWAGVPVVTMEGGHFASRVSSSLLHALNISEMVAVDVGEYEALALSLALDTVRLKSIRNKVACNKNKSPLFDTEKFTKNLEKGYRMMWNRHVRGDPLDHLYVDD